MNLNWKPKNEDGFIGIPGKGVIPASEFSAEDLKALIDRANNRKIDVHSFLLKAGLVKNVAQVEIFEEVKEEVEERPKAKPGRKPKEPVISESVHYKEE
jgi:hypothetical protein